MAADVKNIIVGAAQMFISSKTGLLRPDTSSSALFKDSDKTNSAKSILTADSTNWRDVGYTNNGLEVSYEPGYNDVMVDQLLDAARLFKSTLKVMLKTELSEGTLQNLNLVFGQQESQYTYSGSAGTSNSVFSGSYTGSGTGSAVLNIAAGALGDAPVERAFVAVGNAPGNITYSATGSAVALGTSSTRAERVYVARRVVQIEVTSHSLKRDSATSFPVQFRCLPDDADKYDGAEYGIIIDRILAS